MDEYTAIDPSQKVSVTLEFHLGPERTTVAEVETTVRDLLATAQPSANSSSLAAHGLVELLLDQAGLL